MPHRLHWSDLKIGLIATTVLAVGIVSILLFARIGQLHGKTYKLYVTAPDISGVLGGTEVWVAGKKVGLVRDVRFRPVTTDTLQRVLIEADILDEDMPLIRRDSWADIRPGGNLIGSPVVYIKIGTARAAGLHSGDTLPSRIGGRIAAVGAKVDTMAEDLYALSATTEAFFKKLSDPTNSVGAFRSRGIEDLRNAGEVVSSYTRRATTGNGSVALAYRENALGRLNRLFAQKDSIALLLSAEHGNVGQLRNDSALHRRIASVKSGVDSLRAIMSGAGATRLRTDTTLSKEMARLKSQLDSLMKDAKKHPKTYLGF